MRPTAKSFFLPLSVTLLFAPSACVAGDVKPAVDATPARMLWLGGDERPKTGKPPEKAALVEAAQKALAEHADRLGMDPYRLPEPATVHVGNAGPNIVTFLQTVDGIEAHGARVTVALDDAPSVRAISGRFDKTAYDRKAEFRLGGESALAALLGTRLQTAPELKALKSRNGYQYFDVQAKEFDALVPARLRPVLYSAGEGVVPAYYVELAGRFHDGKELEGTGSIISAENGELLRQASLVDEAAHSYRVFADSTGVPFVDAYGNTFPHPTAMPDGWLPTTPAPMQLVMLDHAGLSTGDPWLPPGATHTVGNNVDAFFNGLASSAGVWTWEGNGPTLNVAEGDFRAALTSGATFDYPYDATATASDYVQFGGDPVTPVPSGSAQLNAKVVQAFYVNNWLHDLFYDLGFDEPAGNSQHDNYGRGGLAGDRLVVNPAYAGTFVYTPADGEAPHMRLGRNGYSGTLRDPSGFDFPVIAHEWAHIMFRRLTPVLPSAIQTRALNEGTADFVGFFLTVQESHRDLAPASRRYSGAYGVGAYFNLDYDFPYDTLPGAGSPGHPDNTYYHGVRRFPYTADMTLNPLTLRHIEHDVDLPAGYMPFDWKFRSLVNVEVHTAGEVWTSALWQCARNLLADETRFTFAERKRRMLEYLVAGLKLFPADATYIEARNGVLFAMRAADVTDYELCRQGFAERGFGAGAIAPERFADGNFGTRESFSTNDAALSFVDWALEETGGGDGDGVLDVGEAGRLTVTLKNTGLVPLTDARIYVPPLSGAYAFPSGSTASGIALQPEEEFTVSFDVNIVTTDGARMLLFNLTARDSVRTDVYDQQDALFTVNYDLRRERNSDWLISQQTFEADWTPGAELAGYSHGCAGDCYGNLETWERVTHLGEFAYRIGSKHVSLDAHIATVPFTRYPAAPFRIVLQHDFDIDRSYGLGEIEISVAGGPWQSIAPFVISGSSSYSGVSDGWRTETIDLGTAFGGQTVQLRWRLTSSVSFDPDPVHWALRRISIEGAATPIFSNMQVDVH